MTPRPDGWLSRLLWFLGLWTCGVLAVTIVGYGLRLWLS